MTVSSVAFSPRQWPPQPIRRCRLVSVYRCEVQQEDRTFLMTIPIDVIAAKKNTIMVSMDHFLIPTNHLCGRCLTKILCIESGLVTMSIDVLSSLLSNLDGVTESFFELSSFGSIAGGVNREALDLDSGLGI